ncbi:hypothetical protein HMPREF9999_02236 [Alloprevotella sp. oral taxon 473 str. F0040]|nr:hypothetical protein HMPREF9999_02236 [Alloprevotella sp. oral taxon 473 str. F0040]
MFSATDFLTHARDVRTFPGNLSILLSQPSQWPICLLKMRPHSREQIRTSTV